MKLEDLSNCFPLSQLEEMLPTKPSYLTVRKWAQEGCRGVKLQTWLIGDRRVTTKEAVEAFIKAVSIEGNEPSSRLTKSPRNQRKKTNKS